MSWFEDLFVKKNEDWTFGQLTAEQVPGEPKNPTPIPVDGAYISIDICSLRIVNLRKFTSTFYGVVHSFIGLNHLSGDVANFQTVTTPSELKKIDPKRLDRVIVNNIPLLGPVPYRGGKISFSVGLFSVKESDLAGPYLDLLGNLAAKAGISVVNTALPFVDTIKNGVDAIIGNSDASILEIGYSTYFNEPPSTGWFAVLRAPKDAKILPTLKVAADDFKLIDAKGNTIKDYPYLVFKITQSRERNDWYNLPDLKEPYGKLQAAVKAGNYTDAEDLLRIFKRFALTSNDLLFADADRIVKLVEERTKAVLKATTVSAAEQKELPDLETYDLYSK
jgi:hypothetical protein